MTAAVPSALPDHADFATRLIAWQAADGRHHLPWQGTRDPYRVWLSEIMLQQTQVVTVLGYYDRFLQRFPDVASLAAAPLDEVLGLWSGLGYYSRARNLHRCAQAVVQQHGGRFPDRAEVLAQLPGIGRSTAAAIAAFCFGERVAILDGNVKRVLSRLLGFDRDLAVAAHERALWDEATRLLPERGIEAYTQGLMDLGATVCTQRSPSCLLCPALPLCAARRRGEPERFPVKTRKLKRKQRRSWWLALRWHGALWLTQRPDTGIWAGLWSLPEFDASEALEAATAHLPGPRRSLAPFTHVMTHLDWTLHTVVIALQDDLDEAQATGIATAITHPLATAPGDAAQPGRWADDQALAALGLSAAVRKLLPQLL